MALISLLEKWEKVFDKKGFTGFILVDLRKNYNTINPELLLAKLNTHGVIKQALLIIFSYLNNRKQRVKRNNELNSFSTSRIKISTIVI